MRSLACLSFGFSSRVRGPAWGVAFLILLAAFGSRGGAEVQGTVPRSIFGGEVASSKEYPFVVRVWMMEYGSSCSGSLIAPNWVLTAAHCALSKDESVARMRICHVDHSTPEPSSLCRSAKRFIPHPQYTFNALVVPRPVHRPNDIALIELSQPFPASSASPLGIPRRSAELIHAPSGTSGVLLGYGRTETNNHGGRLQSVTTNLHYANDCRKRLNFDHTWETQVLHADTVCAGTATMRAATGDSGGPLIVPYSGEGSMKWLQIGVSNRAASGEQPDRTMASVYARVSSFSNWIRQSTRNAVSLIPEADSENIRQLTIQLSQVESQTLSLQDTFWALQASRGRLIQLIDDIKEAERQGNQLQAKEDKILGGGGACCDTFEAGRASPRQMVT